MTHALAVFCRLSAIVVASATLMWSGQMPLVSTSPLISVAKAQDTGSPPKKATNSTKQKKGTTTATSGAPKAAASNCTEEQDAYGVMVRSCK